MNESIKTGEMFLTKFACFMTLLCSEKRDNCSGVKFLRNTNVSFVAANETFAIHDNKDGNPRLCCF